MANLNLSQFTEKTLVVDADWVFVWDTVGAISKKVSRNSLLNSGTLATSAPVTISQTWAAAGQTFKALVVDAAGTSAANSASGSLLLDLQVNGGSTFAVDKTGSINIGNGSFLLRANVSGANEIRFLNNGLLVRSVGETAAARFTGSSFSAVGLSLATTTDLIGNNPGDVRLERDAANTLALRNGAAAQTFRVYNTYSNAGADTEYIQISATSSGHRIGTNSSGMGSSRVLLLGTGGGSQWFISTSGHLGTFGSDNLYDIGASGANRPRNVYVGTSVVAGSVTISGNQINLGSSAGLLQVSGTSLQLGSGTTTSVVLFGGTAGSPILGLGGTTSAFPAIKRSTTSLQARLADDSAFTNIQGKLTTDTAYTATVVVPTGFLTLYDSTGAAYRVPCVV